MIKKEHDITKLSSLQCLRHFIISWSRVCCPLPLESFKKNFKRTRLLFKIVGGIQGRLQSEGRGDLEKRKETYPKDEYISLIVSGVGRSIIFGAKAYFWFFSL